MIRDATHNLQDMRRALRSEGMAVHPIKTRAPYLRGYGFAPDVVFDIGVADGTPWLYRACPDARFVLVDPQAHCAEAVRSNGVLRDFHFHHAALGEAPGSARLNVPVSDRGKEVNLASLRRRTDRLARSFIDIDSTDVQVRTLDDIALGYPGRAGLKIDTEGSELEVLRGGKDTLRRCDFVILELSVSARFEGVGLPSASVKLLADAGLELRDVLTVAAGAGKRARPRYMDVLFTRWAA
ncbi:FkbM family methyltransferase [uncultured Roseobacter sp.]|uniref:FkbM family methyltransferase n=1 Tax=uncultured Roseobacter sp. TaxID=114847 RepID=UPI002609D421|nr:FkbM family methyltransferase [uncultured Roseobacter sp.]